ncbi:MAG: hypothetical protein LBS64_03850 [Spirochaetaceae bacterium]|jgi:hypothetical protein|nr:hypothetical protein [Spirochaetaceae bacterium]
MKTYTFRGYSHNHFMTIVDELDDSFVVRIVRDRGGREEVTTDFMSKDLFDNFIRTGYLSKLPAERPAMLAASA